MNYSFASRTNAKTKKTTTRRYKPQFQLLEERVLPSTFIDNFEGPTLDSFWSTIENSGSVTFPSTEKAHSGNQSVQFNSTANTGQKSIQLVHDFAQPLFGRFSAWAFDTGADIASSNFIGMYAYNTELGTFRGLYSQDFDFGVPRFSNYTVDLSSGNKVDTGIDRTQAWHHFVIDSTPSQLRYEVDGIRVHTESPLPLNRITLQMFSPTWRPAWVSFFDDFEFVPYGPDITPTDLTWNSNQGGVDFKYKVTGAQLPQDTTAQLYWASGPTENDILEQAAVPITISQTTPLDQEITKHIPASDLSGAPTGATHLLAVVDPDKQIDESDEKNNIKDLALTDITLVDATTDDNETIEIEYSINFEDASPFKVDVWLSSDHLLDQQDQFIHATHITDPQFLKADPNANYLEFIQLGTRHVSDNSRFLIVDLDSNDDVVERDESNNTRFVIPLVYLGWKVSGDGEIAPSVGYESSARNSGAFQGEIPQEIAFDLAGVLGPGPRLADLENEGRWNSQSGLQLDFALPDNVTKPDGTQFTNDKWAMPSVAATTAQFVQLLQIDGANWVGGSISINDGYDPTRSGSLHEEARALDIQPLGILQGRQDRLSGLAWLAGFDWVWHEPGGINPHVHASARRSFDTNVLEVQLNSPANILVTAPDGSRSGVDPDTGQVLDEIPLSTFSRKDTHPQVFSMIGGHTGNYSVQVTGTGAGGYTLDLTTTNLVGETTNAQFVGQTAPGVITTYALDYSTQDASETAVEISDVEVQERAESLAFFESQIGTFIVVGGDQRDHIHVKRDPHNRDHLIATINGKPLTGPHSSPLIADVKKIKIEGRAGHDVIHIGQLPGFDGEVMVNGGPGNDIIIGSPGNDLLRGGPGNDRIFGRGGDDILVGGDGRDFLSAGSGRDISIGGQGRDVLLSLIGQDLLIGGYTSFDNDDAALRAIHAEWTNRDRDFRTRVANLRGIDTGDGFADRANGEFFLKREGGEATVFDDGVRDFLFSGRERDWLFYQPLQDWVWASRRDERN